MIDFEMFIKCSVFVSGSWLVVMSLIMNTKNFLSACVFKIIPFILGISCLFSAGKMVKLF